MTTTTMDANEAGLAAGSNYDIIKRLLTFMKPFNGIMFISLATRTLKFSGQAAVLGIAAASIGLYIEQYPQFLLDNPGETVNWSLIWTQVMWIALAGTVVDVPADSRRLRWSGEKDSPINRPERSPARTDTEYRAIAE